MIYDYIQNILEQTEYLTIMLIKIQPQYKYFAYINGEAIEFPSIEHTKKASRLYESVVVNKEQIEQHAKLIENEYKKAAAMWESAVRKYCSSYNDEQYKMLYQFAINDFDAHDLIFNRMDELDNLITSIKSLSSI